MVSEFEAGRSGAERLTGVLKPGYSYFEGGKGTMVYLGAGEPGITESEYYKQEGYYRGVIQRHAGETGASVPTSYTERPAFASAQNIQAEQKFFSAQPGDLPKSYYSNIFGGLAPGVQYKTGSFVFEKTKEGVEKFRDINAVPLSPALTTPKQQGFEFVQRANTQEFILGKNYKPFAETSEGKLNQSGQYTKNFSPFAFIGQYGKKTPILTAVIPENTIKPVSYATRSEKLFGVEFSRSQLIQSRATKQGDIFGIIGENVVQAGLGGLGSLQRAGRGVKELAVNPVKTTVETPKNLFADISTGKTLKSIQQDIRERPSFALGSIGGEVIGIEAQGYATGKVAGRVQKTLTPIFPELSAQKGTLAKSLEKTAPESAKSFEASWKEFKDIYKDSFGLQPTKNLPLSISERTRPIASVVSARLQQPGVRAYGSQVEATYIKPSKVPADIDIATAKMNILPHSAPLVEEVLGDIKIQIPKRYELKGTTIELQGKDILSVHTAESLSTHDFYQFWLGKTTPKGERITSFNEQYARKLFGAFGDQPHRYTKDTAGFIQMSAERLKVQLGKPGVDRAMVGQSARNLLGSLEERKATIERINAPAFPEHKASLIVAEKNLWGLVRKTSSPLELKRLTPQLAIIRQRALTTGKPGEFLRYQKPSYYSGYSAVVTPFRYPAYPTAKTPTGYKPFAYSFPNLPYRSVGKAEGGYAQPRPYKPNGLGYTFKPPSYPSFKLPGGYTPKLASYKTTPPYAQPGKAGYNLPYLTTPGKTPYIPFKPSETKTPPPYIKEYQFGFDEAEKKRKRQRTSFKLPKDKGKRIITPWADLLSVTRQEIRTGRPAKHPSVKIATKWFKKTLGFKIPTADEIKKRR